MLDQAHLTSLLENATEGILLTNSTGIIIMANPSSLKMFGYDEREMRGGKIEMLLPEKIHEKHIGMRQGFYTQPGNRSMGSGRDLHARKKNGTIFPVEVSLSHYQKDNEMYVIAFVVDISKRKEIETNLINKQLELEKVTNDIRKLNTELEQRVDQRTHILKEALQKLEQSQNELNEALDKERQLNEIKSRFVSMASHEFRTPLSTVLSSASLLTKYTKEEDQENRDRHISRIKGSVKHLNDILEDFLSLGRLNEGRIAAEPSDFNMKELIEEIISDLKIFFKKGQHFKNKYDAPENVFADKKLLKNILINLLSNAIKFSGENSVIILTAKLISDEIVIEIKDQGIGIPEEDQKNLFSSFYRGSNANNIQGTGLGLHIVKRYIDLLGGTVALQSKLGKGTQVEIKFPRVKK